jgi:DNA (cytosine-5)-methyltransferase 1
METKPTAISLFSGMGGDSLGIQHAGFDVVAFNEFDKAAVNAHLYNFPNSVLIQDLTQKKANDIQNISDEKFSHYKGKVDMVFAGHPCQGFSNGGKKLPDDPRNTLFREFARVCKLVKPKYIIGENVDGLLSRKTATGENYIDVIVKEFHDIGYNVSYQVCHAVKYGVPQLRKRLVYVGIRKDLNQTYTFPEPLNDGKTNLPNLQHIIQFDMKGAIKIEPDDFDMTTIPDECILKDLNNTDDEIPEDVHPYLRLKAKTRNEEYNGKTHTNMLSFSKRDSPIHAEIIDIRNPSKTIICTYDHQPRLFVPLQNKNGFYIRCILPDELKQIQGFPVDFKLCGTTKDKIKQIGNAVPPPLITQIVSKLMTSSTST